ncbi:hypothetical protein JX265_014152, partial [Neoarthrinium moseri]
MDGTSVFRAATILVRFSLYFCLFHRYIWASDHVRLGSDNGDSDHDEDASHESRSDRVDPL